MLAVSLISLKSEVQIHHPQNMENLLKLKQNHISQNLTTFLKRLWEDFNLEIMATLKVAMPIALSNLLISEAPWANYTFQVVWWFYDNVNSKGRAPLLIQKSQLYWISNLIRHWNQKVAEKSHHFLESKYLSRYSWRTFERFLKRFLKTL